MSKRVFSIGIAIGIILIVGGLISLISGLEYDRNLNGQQTIQSLHAYSFSFHSSAGLNVHVDYDLGDGNMSVIITNSEGHDELVSTGYPSDENILKILNDTSNDSINWTPSIEGSYYVVFIQFTEDVSTLDASISYTGTSPELLQLGIILIVIGTAVALVGVILRTRKPKIELEGPGVQNEPGPPDA